MARPLRLEFAGALYHVTSRGDHQEDIFLSEDDRQDWLVVLGIVCDRFNWVIHAFCQMTSHYHLRPIHSKAEYTCMVSLMNAMLDRR